MLTASVSEADIITVLDDNNPPVADAGGPYFVVFGDDITLDGTGSYDPDPGDSITDYWWDLDGDGIFDDQSAPTPVLTVSDYEYLIGAPPDSFTVALMVLDTSGASGSDSSTVFVQSSIVPEPSTLTFLGAGLLGVLIYFRRFNHRTTRKI
jgi:hypothetical protein